MNKIIINDHKSCNIILDDENLFNILRKKLSYKELGVEYSPAYQNGWNGINYLINKKGYFYSGLQTKVEEFLKDHKLEYIIEDKRIFTPKSEIIDLMPKLTKMNMIPRDYQNRIIDACLNNYKGIVRAATGSGKTNCISILTAKLNKSTNIYIIGLDLLQQFYDLFTKLFDEPIGYIGNGICKIERINIVSIWTVGSALSLSKNEICDDEDIECDEKIELSHKEKIVKLLEDTKVHIFDESHVITTNTIAKIYKNIMPEYIYGFSGTPFKQDNTDLKINSILGEQIVNVNASELIEKKVLAQPIIKFISVPKMSGLQLQPYLSVYKQYIVENQVRNNLIIKNIKELIEKKYTVLALFKQIKHGKILFDMMQQEDISCELLYGNDSLERRTEVKQMLNDKKINVLLASTILDIGFDAPIVSALVLCGSGKSYVRCLQRIGRCIRGYKGKTHAAIVEFYDQAKFLKKHSMTRYEIYCSEPGFKVIKCKEMK